MNGTPPLRHIAAMILVIVCLLASGEVRGQVITAPNQRQLNDSIRREFDDSPYFGLYKDNYFIVGTTLGGKPTRTNSDVKFQISIAQRLTRSTLPWHTFLYLFYSQKCLWNVFEKSMPMRDLNFNPGVGLTKPFFARGRYIGKLSLIVEHESNGRDGKASRSWNKISLAGSVMVDEWLAVHAKYWIPIVDGENNRDILRYSGVCQYGVQVTDPQNRFGASITLVKRQGWNFNFNTIVEFNYKIFPRDNQFLFLQYYNGYGECLLDYNKFHSRIRAGIVIKPKFFSEF